jgi:hypothetical protein
MLPSGGEGGEKIFSRLRSRHGVVKFVRVFAFKLVRTGGTVGTAGATAHLGEEDGGIRFGANLALAEAGLDMVAPCSGCYYREPQALDIELR